MRQEDETEKEHEEGRQQQIVGRFASNQVPKPNTKTRSVIAELYDIIQRRHSARVKETCQTGSRVPPEEAGRDTPASAFQVPRKRKLHEQIFESIWHS